MRRARRFVVAAAFAAALAGGGAALALPQQQGSVDLLDQAFVQWLGPGEAQGGSHAGGSVALLGDVFGAGRSAVAIGAPEAQPGGRLGAGSVYVVAGQQGGGAVDLTALRGRGFRIDGAQAGDQLGYSLAALRLRDGDPGLAIGAPYASPGGRSQAGVVYVVDLARLHSDLDLSAARAGGALVGEMTGPGACAESGFALAAIAPLGFGPGDDLLIGSPGADPHGCPASTASGPVGGNSGAAFLVFGARGVGRHFDLAAPGSLAETFRGIASGDRAGAAVSAAGPHSLMIGAPYATALGRNGAGQVYLLHRALPGGAVSLAALPAGSTTLEGPAANDATGSALAATSGYVAGSSPSAPELVIGAPQGTPRSRTHAGSVFIVREYGLPATVDLKSINAPGSPGGEIDGADAGDEAGYALASIGDVLGNGRAAIAIGAPFLNSQTGVDRIDNGGVYVLYGGRGDAKLDLARIRSRGYVAFGARDDDEAGTALAGGLDVNGDGRPDVVIGAPFAENSLGPVPQEGGGAYLVLGIGTPLLRYPGGSQTFHVGVRVSLAPVSGHTGVAAFSVTPALPRGLSLNRGSGLISGVPRAAHAVALYSVTMSDLAGSAEQTLTLTVLARRR